MTDYNDGRRSNIWFYVVTSICLLSLACSLGGLFSEKESPRISTPDAVRVTQSTWEEEIEEVEQLPVSVPETTVVFEEDIGATLKTASEDASVLTFSESSPELESLVPGKVIVSDSTNVAPDGFLRKVTKVSTSGDQVIVETEPARLEEAIESGTAQVSHTLHIEDLQSALPVEGVAAQKVRLLPARKGINVRIDNIVLTDADGNSGTTHDQVVANGDVFLEPSFDFSLSIEDYSLKALTFVNRTKQRSKLEISAGAKMENLNVTKQVAHYQFSPVTVWVGWVPVVVNPVMTIFVSADGNVSADLRTNISQQANLDTGINYKNGSWRPVYDLSNEFNYTLPDLTGRCNFQAAVGPRLDLLLYGQPGPYGVVEGYLMLNADPQHEPWWQLTGGIQAEIGIDLGVLSTRTASYSQKVLDEQWPLAQAERGSHPAEEGSGTPVSSAQTTDEPEDTPIPQRPTSGTIYLEADGSGDYPSIQEAIDEVEPGATLVLGPGKYIGRFKMDKALTILGAGRDLTELYYEGQGNALMRLSAAGAISLEDITLHSPHAFNIIMDNGELTISNSHLYVGESDDIWENLVIRGKSQVNVVNSVISGGTECVVLEDQAHISMTNSKVTECRIGIEFYGSSTGVIQHNEIRNHRWEGVRVGPTGTSVIIENNLIQNNGREGIGVWQGASAFIRWNDCSYNEDGIEVDKEPKEVVIENNTLNNNEENGIYFFQFSSGYAQGNECAWNGKYGIYISSPSTTILGSNNCHDNGEEDIRDTRD